MITEAVVLAGGMGTRLKSVIDDLPKPMAAVVGRPFLEYQLNYLAQQGIQTVILSVGYQAQTIIDYFGDQFGSLQIKYSIEQQPLGTGGGLQKAFEMVQNEAAFVVNGDTLFEVDLPTLAHFHQQTQSEFSLALRQLPDVSRYGAVVLSDQKRIVRFAEKGQFEGSGFINGGTYLIQKDFFKKLSLPEKFSLELEVFEKMHTLIPFYGATFESYFLDIGIPEDYQKAQYEIPKLGY